MLVPEVEYTNETILVSQTTSDSVQNLNAGVTRAQPLSTIAMIVGQLDSTTPLKKSIIELPKADPNWN